MWTPSNDRLAIAHDELSLGLRTHPPPMARTKDTGNQPVLRQLTVWVPGLDPRMKPPLRLWRGSSQVPSGAASVGQAIPSRLAWVASRAPTMVDGSHSHTVSGGS